MMHLFGPPVPPPRSQWLHVWIEEKRHRQIETLLDEAFATLSDLRAIQRRKPELADIAPELPAFTRELASLIVRVRVLRAASTFVPNRALSLRSPPGLVVFRAQSEGLEEERRSRTR